MTQEAMVNLPVSDNDSRRPTMDQNVQEASSVSPQSLSSVAYGYLLSRLRNGHVGSSQRLVEADIAAQLGVSRVPVRQALLQLVAEGYLVSTARGYRMPALSATDIQDVFELRLLLEPRAAALAARDISAAQLEQLGLAIAEAESGHAAGDLPRVLSAGLHFREGWLGSVRNSRLAATITRYADQVLLVRHTTLRDTSRQRRVIAGFQELRDAFARHDSVAAHDAMLRFVLAAERDFSELARSD